MKKPQIILLIGAIIIVILIYQLPRVVVENDQLSEVNNVKPHELTVTTADNEVIISLREQIKGLSENKKSINFADSLATIYLKYQFIDSAVMLARQILEIDSSANGKYLAANIYSKASQGEANTEKVVGYANEAKVLFTALLEGDPENLSLKNKLAMTLMTTDTPMQGVLMLREILEVSPENREAIFNLGLLAIRSGQYDKAEERFVKLTELNANDFEAVFYLGVVYAQSEQSEKAVKTFKKYMEFDGTDAAMKATAANFLKELENIK
jgi:outer membrane protein